MVTIAELREKWKHLGLPEEQLGAILQLDNFGEEVEWMKFLALGCSVLGEVCSQQEPSYPNTSGCLGSMYKIDHRTFNADGFGEW